ncbi:MAG: enoyl-CoA hydratase [Actinomycetota bacterium]|nr:enoyl-CoA hydratase [Actinomycetota bacterium]
MVVYETAGSTARITINRPDRRNAINPEVVRGLASSLERAEQDETVSVAVITGAGDKAFCAGGDLEGMSTEGRVRQHLERADVGGLFEAMRASRLPIIARVNGHALAGGFGLMLACDLVVAAEGADVGTPEIDIGLWPFMITALIQRDVPRKVALEMMLTGKRMPVAEAHRWGFVNRVVEATDLDGEVDALAKDLSSKSPLIVQLGKKSFYEAEDMAVGQALDYLSGMLTVCLESEDTIEGVTAFLQKRSPQWRSR